MRYHWERKKVGYYQFIGVREIGVTEEGIFGEVARGADGKWWAEWLDERGDTGWTFGRFESLKQAQLVVFTHARMLPQRENTMGVWARERAGLPREGK